MKFRVASATAALGTALVSLSYLVNNVVPILRNLGAVALSGAAVVIFTTIVPSLTWTVFFAACWKTGGPRPARGAVWGTLLLAVAVPDLYLASQQWSYFSFFALDSYSYLLTGVLLPLGWVALLVRMLGAEDARPRRVAVVVLLLSALAAAPEVYGSVTALIDAAQGSFQSAWGYDPWQAFWRLLAIPAIRVFYWASQVVFLAACAELDSARRARYKS